MVANGYVDTDVVTEVNGETGDVDLSAADVGAEASGAVAAAVTAHSAATDPHGDRAYADAGLAGKVSTSAYTSFANATLGTGVTKRASGGTPGSRSEPADTVRLRGAIDISGNPAAGTVLLTLDARDAPVGGEVIHPGVRTGPTGNISTVLHINTSGQVTLAAAPGNAAYLGLDGITYVRTVA